MIDYSSIVSEKIEKKADAEGITPKEYVDKVAAVVKNIYDMLDVSYDRFIRTTDDDHVKACQHIFKKLYDQGDIYKDEYEGWYCTPCESFFTELFVYLVSIKRTCMRKPITFTVLCFLLFLVGCSTPIYQPYSYTVTQSHCFGLLTLM